MMLDRQWRLAYGSVVQDMGGVDPTDVFERHLGRVMVRAYEVSETATTQEDTPNARDDGLRMGQDYRQGVTHTFTLGIKGRTRSEAETLLAALQRAWRGDSVRLQAGGYATLTYNVGGQERTMFGRPRKFQPNYDLLVSAEATALATFETLDDVWYGPEQTARIDLRAIAVGGFTFPFTFPLAMSQPTTKSGLLDVKGTLPTPVALEIHGPIANPVVTRVGGWTAKLQTNLSANRVVTIDARSRSVTDQNGASFAGAASRATRLAALLLTPSQQQQILFSGTDPTSSAYLVTRWRDAYAGRA